MVLSFFKLLVGLVSGGFHNSPRNVSRFGDQKTDSPDLKPLSRSCFLPMEADASAPHGDSPDGDAGGVDGAAAPELRLGHLGHRRWVRSYMSPSWWLGLAWWFGLVVFHVSSS